MAGNLSFIFGSQEVTQNFPSNGVYDYTICELIGTISYFT